MKKITQFFLEGESPTLSSDNLLTGYEQKLLTIKSKFINLCFISTRLIHVT